MAVLSQHGKKLSGTEIHFLSRDEVDYPQLTRLCLDFDFRVLGIAPAHAQASTQYLISEKHYRDQDLNPITPLFDSLAELEHYTNAHIIDILYATLFDDADNNPTTVTDQN